jgi:hypothetical protein
VIDRLAEPDSHGVVLLLASDLGCPLLTRFLNASCQLLKYIMAHALVPPRSEKISPGHRLRINPESNGSMEPGSAAPTVLTGNSGVSYESQRGDSRSVALRSVAILGVI